MLKEQIQHQKEIQNKATIIAVIACLVITAIILPTFAYVNGYERSIKVEKDAYVIENYPDTNYGADDYLRVGNYNLGRAQTFYYFNISTLPDEWTKAYIVVNFDYSPSTVDVGANLTYEKWNEMTITWNNKPNKSIYRGHIFCDGFDFNIPLNPDQIVNDGVGICLYGRGGGEDGYIQGCSKEGASKSDDIALIELRYLGIDPNIINGLIIAAIVILIVILTLVGSYFIFILSSKNREKFTKKNAVHWRKANVGVKKNVVKADWIKAKMIEYNKYKLAPSLEKKINQYITLRLEHGKTYIYINGKRFIQCIRLILNIPKVDTPLYDEVESIDEAAKLYNKQIYQNRIVTGPMAFPVQGQSHNITPEQEFWGHCSNIQAWVEHDYDTRILMSNISFPMLRELTRAGDPKARKLYKEEIALRLESGYPSVVQYLLAQGYINEFTPAEFLSILESTNLIKKISSEPKILFHFLRSCILKFPNLIEYILLQILKLPDSKNAFLSIFQKEPLSPTFIPFPRYTFSQFLYIIKNTLKNLINRVDEKTGEQIIDYIHLINQKVAEQNLNTSRTSRLESMRNIFLDNLLGKFDEKQKFFIKHKNLEQVRKRESKCSYCGRVLPKGKDICDWCGHKKDDDEFFPYPFIFKPPGGGGGSMKGVAVVPIKVKT